MFSKKGARLLEESAEERSYGSTSHSGPSIETETKNKAELTSSAPAVLEPSKDGSRPLESHNERTFEDSASPPLNPWRTLVTCSCPGPSTRVPISSDDQTNVQGDEQQILDEQIDGHHSIFSTLINSYKNTAITLRNSIFIHIFQALFCVIPISAIVMGLLFDGECNESELLPIFGTLTGFIGTIFTAFWMSLSCYNRLGLSSTDIHKLLFVVFFIMFLFALIMEIVMFGMMSIDHHAPNCHKTFYYYSFYKYIAVGATAFVAAVLYLPGSLHYFCCHCFSEDRLC